MVTLKQNKPLAAIAVLILLFVVASCNSSNVKLQKLDLLDLNGKKVSMSDYEGKPLFLNFWATWCGPCVKELPGIATAKKELKQAGFDYEFVFVSDEAVENLKQFILNRPFNFDFLQLQGNIKMKGIFSIPQTYIFDKNGNIVHSHTGYANWGDEQHIELLKNLAR